MNPNYIVWACMAIIFIPMLAMAVFFVVDAYREGKE